MAADASTVDRLQPFVSRPAAFPRMVFAESGYPLFGIMR
jgi:hypothetical protein